MNTHTPIPLVPDRSAVERRGVQTISRAMVCAGRSLLDRKTTAVEHAKAAYQGDDDVARFLKAAMNPTDTTAPLVGFTQSLLAALVPTSASGGLSRAAGEPLAWDAGTGVIQAPAIDLTNALPTWIAEGQPYRVPQGVSAVIKLTPFKMGVILALTSEIWLHTYADVLIQRNLTEVLGYALDASLFSSNAAVPGLSPAGLLNGLTTLGASTESITLENMIADLSKLAAAVSVCAGNGRICFIAAPAQATAIRLRCPEIDESYMTFASAAIPPQTVIAVAANSFALAAASPHFETSSTATIHLEDTSPLPIGTPGAPPIVAAPVMSALQGDLVMLKFRWFIDWKLRHPAGCAFISGTNW